jgi:predicted dehydrogenase
MAKRVGVGVVGLDHWYTAFAAMEAASKGAGARLVAVADGSKERLSEVAKKYRADYVTRDAGRVIADPRVELVCSLANTRENVGVVRRALRAGKHVACVKPAAMTLRQLDGLIELAESNERVLWSFDQLGRAGVSARLKALIKGGGIGQPLSFHQAMWAGLPQPWRGKIGPSWWTDPKLVPFGAWADHAIYTIDMIRSLFEAEVEMAYGEIANLRYPELGVEDYGVGTLRLSNGMVAVIEQTWTAGGYCARWTKIAGTEGVIHIEPAVSGGAPVVATKRGMKVIRAGEGRAGVLGPVLSLVEAGSTKPSPARESRANLAVAFAVYRAAKTGRHVRLGQPMPGRG